MDIVKNSILKAAAGTILILLVGILVGLQADDARKGFVENQLKESNLQTQTFMVTQNYLDQSSRNYCKVVESRIPELAEENTEIGQSLESFTGKSISNRKDYEYLRREYYLNQLRLYNILNEYKSRCNTDNSLVFFFFDGSANSKRQGAALTKYYREVDNSTYIFSYNLDTEDSEVLDVLRSDYNITTGPAVVLNGNKTFRSYVPFGELKQELK
jgi:hypothetical protein